MWWQFYASPSPRERRPFSSFLCLKQKDLCSTWSKVFNTKLFYLNTPLFFLNFTQYVDVLTDISDLFPVRNYSPNMGANLLHLVMYKSSYRDSCCTVLLSLLPFPTKSVILAAKHERLIWMKIPISIKVNLNDIRKQIASQSKHGEEGKTYKQ